MKTFKKFVIAVFLFIVLCINTLAISGDIITPDNDFIIYSANKQKVADILGASVSELDEKVKNQGIVFLAVNNDNTKQIQMTETVTDFSQKVSDFSNLSDRSIISLLPTISGMDNISGNVVTHNGQKYGYIKLKQKESGYILTQYFTVKEKKLYTVTFYTEEGISTDYIETAFSTEDLIRKSIIMPGTDKGGLVAVIVGTVIFGVIFILILYTLIKDFKNTRKNQH